MSKYMIKCAETKGEWEECNAATLRGAKVAASRRWHQRENRTLLVAEQDTYLYGREPIAEKVKPGKWRNINPEEND